MISSIALLLVLVHPGNTMSGIAAAHGTTWQAVWAANPQVSNPNLIYPGQRLTMPSGRTVIVRSRHCGDGDGDDACTWAADPPARPADPPPVHHAITAVLPASAIPGWASACIVPRESGGNPTAVNPYSGASGLFQDLPTTWGNYDGYSSAASAPVSVQIQFNQVLSDYGRNLSPWAADGCPGT